MNLLVMACLKGAILMATLRSVTGDTNFLQILRQTAAKMVEDAGTRVNTAELAGGFCHSREAIACADQPEGDIAMPALRSWVLM